jgi:hypothetical protein
MRPPPIGPQPHQVQLPVALTGQVFTMSLVAPTTYQPNDVAQELLNNGWAASWVVFQGVEYVASHVIRQGPPIAYPRMIGRIIVASMARSPS